MLTKFLRSLTKKAVPHPLETISICLLITCICYLSLVHLFPYISSSSPVIKPLRILLKDNHAVAVDKIESLGFLLEKAAYKSNAPVNLILRPFVVETPKLPVLAPNSGILAKSVLKSVAELQSSIARVPVMDANGHPFYLEDFCYRLADGKCAVITPLQVWNNSVSDMAADQEFLKTIQGAVQNKAQYFQSLRFNEADLVGASSMTIMYVLRADSLKMANLISDWDEKLATIRTEQLYPVYPPNFAFRSGPRASLLQEVGWKFREFIEVL